MKKFKKKTNLNNKDLQIIRILPNHEENIINLNEEKTSWVKVKFKKIKADDQFGFTMNEFEDLWKLKPEKKLQIKIAGKLIDCPR
jgi:hypothetical protein